MGFVDAVACAGDSCIRAVVLLDSLHAHAVFPHDLAAVDRFARVPCIQSHAVAVFSTGFAPNTSLDKSEPQSQHTSPGVSGHLSSNGHLSNGDKPLSLPDGSSKQQQSHIGSASPTQTSETTAQQESTEAELLRLRAEVAELKGALQVERERSPSPNQRLPAPAAVSGSDIGSDSAASAVELTSVRVQTPMQTQIESQFAADRPQIRGAVRFHSYFDETVFD